MSVFLSSPRDFSLSMVPMMSTVPMHQHVLATRRLATRWLATRLLEMRERVRVGSFRETQRADESVVFQRFFTLAPGDSTLTLGLRDEGSPRTVSREAEFQAAVHHEHRR